jgi:hypothetical protein
MPIWLRKFTFSKMREYYDKQNASNIIAKIKQNIQTSGRNGTLPNILIRQHGGKPEAAFFLLKKF